MNDEILPTRITAIKNGEVIEGVSTRPDIASRPNEWRGAVFEEHQLPPQYVEPETMTQHFVAVPLNHDRRKVLWKLGGKESHIDLDPGSVTIHAAGDEASVLWKQPMHIMA